MKFRRKQPSDAAPQQAPTPKKPKAVLVDKAEVSEGKVKFYAAKGFSRNQWIVIKEFPVAEIESVEKFGGELTVNWKGGADSFASKEKTDILGKLAEQINLMLDEQRNSKAAAAKAEQRRSELLEAVNSSLGAVDASFDILIGLQEKRINWLQIEAASKCAGVSVSGQSIPPLSVDFAKAAASVKSQVPKNASNEAYLVLKSVYEYFDGLNLEDDPKEVHPNLQDAKSLVSAYFMFNDLLLGKAVGDKENGEEISQLESALTNLSVEMNFKVDVEQLKKAVNKLDVANKRDVVVGGSRELFKQQLKQQLKPTQPSTAPQLTPKNESAAVLAPENKAAAEPLPVCEAAAAPAVKEAVAAELITKVEVAAEPVPKEEAVPEPAVKEEPIVEPAAKEIVPTEPPPQTEATEAIPKNEEIIEPAPKQEAAAEAVPNAEVIGVAEPVSKDEAASEPASKVEASPEPPAKVEAETEPVAKEETIPEPIFEVKISPVPVPKDEVKPQRIMVSKLEVSGNTAKFSAAKGLFGRQLSVVKEIPLLEIERIDKFGNEISLTWKGDVYTFFSKEKTNIFRPLVDQVNTRLEGARSEPAATATEQNAADASAPV